LKWKIDSGFLGNGKIDASANGFPEPSFGRAQFVLADDQGKNQVRPASSVVAVRRAPVSRFFAVTAAAEIGAPDASVTVPAMLAATCARAVCKEIAVKNNNGNEKHPL